MRVLVCGGRHYHNAYKVNAVLDDIHDMLGINTIIEGGSTGADALAKTWAEDHEINVESYGPDWKKFGKAAGPIRNLRMIEEGVPDLVVAFPGNKGTDNMIKQASFNKIKTLIIKEDAHDYF